MQFVGMLSSEQAPSLTPNLMSVPAKQIFTSLLAQCGNVGEVEKYSLFDCIDYMLRS
jgi:hypothetical protein